MTNLARSSDVRNQTEQRVLRGSGGRNENREAGDVSARQACTAEFYGAFVLLYDSFADPKAQSGSFCRFCGEKRLEQTLCIVGLDAGAGIQDRNSNSCTLRRRTIGLLYVNAQA